MGFVVACLIVALAILWSRVSSMKKEIGILRADVDRVSPEVVLATKPSVVPSVVVRSSASPASPRPPEVDDGSPVIRNDKPSPWAPAVPMEMSDEDVTSLPSPPASPKTEDRRKENVANSGGFEHLFGRTLPIWAGGLTLAITGILGVKWSIDAGILTEGVRVFLGVLFGLGLIGGAFVMRERDDERISQSLSGAGIASLYGAILSAHLLYGLVGSGTALAGMILVTLGGGALSMLFGAPSALLALIGGLAAPALIGGEGNVPALSLYVMSITGGAAFLARLQDRLWLAGSAMAGGLLWAAVAGIGMESGSLFVIMLILFSAFLVPLVCSDSPQKVPFGIVGAALGIFQCAGLVLLGGFGIVQWAGLFLATAGCLWLARKKEFKLLPLMAGGVAFLVLLAWRDANSTAFVLLTLLFAGVHAGHAAIRVSRSESGIRLDSARLVASAPLAAFAIVAYRLPQAGMMSGVICAIAAAIMVICIEWISNMDQDDDMHSARPVAMVFGLLGAWWMAGETAFPVAAAGIVLAAFWRRGWAVSGGVGIGVLTVFALAVNATWLSSAAAAIAGRPFLVTGLPPLSDLLRTLVPLALVTGAAFVKMRDQNVIASRFFILLWASAVLVLVHSLWKQVFGVDGAEEFVALGMAERTLWELALAIAAVVAFRFNRCVSVALGGMSLMHFAWFTLLLHGPAWSAQAVGSLPLFNLVGLSCLTALALLHLAGRIKVLRPIEGVRNVMQMALITATGLLVLRQAFAGSLMETAPVSQAEDIARSLLIVVISIGFLLHGLRKQALDWRIGSLLLMLVAVIKVFLFDVSGLDGLARIASFAALGFSLIGVGWLYARLLPERG